MKVFLTILFIVLNGVLLGSVSAKDPTISQMVSTYEANQARFHTQHRGIVLNGVGTVKAIEADIFGIGAAFNVQLDVNGSNLHCSTSDRNAAASLDKGQRYHFNGSVHDVVFGTLLVRGCTFRIFVSPPPVSHNSPPPQSPIQPKAEGRKSVDVGQSQKGTTQNNSDVIGAKSRTSSDLFLDKPVVLRGRLSTRKDGFNPRTETLDTEFNSLKLQTSVNVFEDSARSVLTESNVRELQVVPLRDQDRESVIRNLDKDVYVIGTIFTAETGWHQTKVLVIPWEIMNLNDASERVSPDLIDVVFSFYTDLSLGNGVQANDKVIPERRNSGPFSIDGIKRFYGGMQKRLSVERIATIDKSSVQVEYNYVSGKTQCRGVARVTTEKRGGAPLISKISANC